MLAFNFHWFVPFLSSDVKSLTKNKQKILKGNYDHNHISLINTAGTVDIFKSCTDGGT